MNGIKLGFTFADYAKATGKGIGSVRLKDGSSVKILSDPEKLHSTEFYRVKNGRLLEAYGSRGRNSIKDIVGKLLELERNKAEGVNIDKEFTNSFNKIV